VGMELVVPASNNASLTLAPNKVAAIARLRGMFRQIGAITSIAVATALMTRGNQVGRTKAHIFITLEIFSVAWTPLACPSAAAQAEPPSSSRSWLRRARQTPPVPRRRPR